MLGWGRRNAAPAGPPDPAPPVEARVDWARLAPSGWLHLSWPDSDGTETRVRGRLHGKSDEQFWVTLAPGSYDASMLRPGFELTAFAPDERGMWVIPARVVGEDTAGRLCLGLTGPVGRVQRRDFVRVAVELGPLAAWLLGAGGARNAPLTIEPIDLSGGGMRFRCSRALREGERVGFSLDLEEEPPIGAAVTLIRDAEPVEVTTLAKLRYMARGRFSTIEERDRERIVRYVFRRQAALIGHRLPA